MEKENVTFEEALNKLTTAVNKLENGEIQLDEAFKMFEEGIKYARICEEKLNAVEEKVAKLMKDGKESDFKVEEPATERLLLAVSEPPTFHLPLQVNSPLDSSIILDV